VNQQPFTFDKSERDVGQMWQSPFTVTVKNNVFNSSLNLIFKAIAQPARVFTAIAHFRPGELSGNPEAYDVCDWFSAGATLSFLMSADLLRE
jgi:hypothetical protein